MNQDAMLDTDSENEDSKLPLSDDGTSQKLHPAKSACRTRRGLASQLETVEPIVNAETQVYTTQIKYLLRAAHDLRKGPVKAEDEAETENVASNGLPVKSAKLNLRSRIEDASIEDITNKRPPSPSFSPDPDVPIKRRRQPKGVKKLLQKLQNQKTKCLQTFCGDVMDVNAFADLNDDYDDDIRVTDADVANRDVIVKFSRNCEVFKISMRMKQPFVTILSELSKMWAIPERKLLLSLNDNTITPEDTPYSISLSVCDIINCGMVQSTETEAAAAPSEVSDPDKLTLKFQSKDQKRKIEISVKKQTPILYLKKKYSEQTQVDVGKVVFKFDGDVLNDDDTPEELELEDGYCIDVLVQS